MGLFDFFKKKQVLKISEEDRSQFTADMAANADALVRQFKDVANLDFSVDSLHILDKVIEDNRAFYKQGDDETKRKMIIRIGAYIFEVARQNYGGAYFWYNRLDQPVLVTGQPEFEMSLLAYERTKLRFENTREEDNIPTFFNQYVEGVKNKHTVLIA